MSDCTAATSPGTTRSREAGGSTSVSIPSPSTTAPSPVNLAPACVVTAHRINRCKYTTHGTKPDHGIGRRPARSDETGQHNTVRTTLAQRRQGWIKRSKGRTRSADSSLHRIAAAFASLHLLDNFDPFALSALSAVAAVAAVDAVATIAPFDAVSALHALYCALDLQKRTR